MLRNRNRRHRVPELNTTSTADISFMLLTFFLVTTSMDTDQGITQQLPPIQKDTEQTPTEIKRRNVMAIAIDGDDIIACDGHEVTLAELRDKVRKFVDNSSGSTSLPEKVWRDIPLLGRCAVTANHLIYLQADRQTSYNVYFNVQNAIAAAYNDLRSRLAEQRFGHPYSECTAEQRDAIMKYYPQRMSENELDMEGGAE